MVMIIGPRGEFPCFAVYGHLLARDYILLNGHSTTLAAFPKLDSVLGEGYFWMGERKLN